ncbi:hypothetical protein [Methyloterricola oryzae]|uniref:hypothetical protein n=1 Tax=Methyloterricola oryzae TaxID=1495050 RepID=UPI0005EBB54D|nr:hypothetical protein [Methyloterricola oryzae]
MKTILISTLVAACLGGGASYAAQSEWEPNDTPGEANANAFSNLDIKDERVGQLKSSDIDFFYIDVPERADRPITPVYFGCNVLLDDFVSGTCPSGAPKSEGSDQWTIAYYSPDGAKQSEYALNSRYCKQGSADVKGPYRFQMNTATPGRYYVSVTYILKQCEEDSAVYGITPTADYTLRAFTTRTKGMPEPNDGQIEASKILNNKPVTGQFASMYDQDWYKYAVTKGSDKPTQVYFSCKGAPSGAHFFLSWFDPNGVLQSSYEVTAPECLGKKFNFEMTTPAAGDYYLAVTPPTYLLGGIDVAGPTDSSKVDNTDPGSQGYANALEFSSHDYVLKVAPGKKKNASNSTAAKTTTTTATTATGSSAASEKCSGISCFNQPF